MEYREVAPADEAAEAGKGQENADEAGSQPNEAPAQPEPDAKRPAGEEAPGDGTEGAASGKANIRRAVIDEGRKSVMASPNAKVYKTGMAGEEKVVYTPKDGGRPFTVGRYAFVGHTLRDVNAEDNAIVGRHLGEALDASSPVGERSENATFRIAPVKVRGEDAHVLFKVFDDMKTDGMLVEFDVLKVDSTKKNPEGMMPEVGKADAAKAFEVRTDSMANLDRAWQERFKPALVENMRRKGFPLAFTATERGDWSSDTESVAQFDAAHGTEVARIVELSNALSSGDKVGVQRFSRRYLTLAKTSEFLKQIGIQGEKFTVGSNSIKRHHGVGGNHVISPNEWMSISESLSSGRPLGVTRYYNPQKKSVVQNAYRIWTNATIGGKTAIVGVEVKSDTKNLFVNSVSTVFGLTDAAIRDELLVYPKSIEEFRSVLADQNRRRYPETPTTRTNVAQSDAEVKTVRVSGHVSQGEASLKDAVEHLRKVRDDKNAAPEAVKEADAAVEAARAPDRPFDPPKLKLKPNARVAAKIVGEFVSKDKKRTALLAPYHDKANGVVVATDGSSLIATKHGFDPNVADRQFPKWKQVIPANNDLALRTTVNPSALAKACKEAVRLARATGSKMSDGEDRPYVVLRFGDMDAVYDAERLERVARAMAANGITEIRAGDNPNVGPLVAKNGETVIVLLPLRRSGVDFRVGRNADNHSIVISGESGRVLAAPERTDVGPLGREGIDAAKADGATLRRNVAGKLGKSPRYMRIKQARQRGETDAAKAYGDRWEKLNAESRETFEKALRAKTDAEAESILIDYFVANDPEFAETNRKNLSMIEKAERRIAAEDALEALVMRRADADAYLGRKPDGAPEARVSQTETAEGGPAKANATKKKADRHDAEGEAGSQPEPQGRSDSAKTPEETSSAAGSPLDGYLAGRKPMDAARIRKTLGKTYRYVEDSGKGGKSEIIERVESEAAFVERSAKEGATLSATYTVSRGGKAKVEYTLAGNFISKTAAGYARHLGMKVDENEIARSEEAVRLKEVQNLGMGVRKLDYSASDRNIERRLSELGSRKIMESRSDLVAELEALKDIKAARIRRGDWNPGIENDGNAESRKPPKPDAATPDRKGNAAYHEWIARYGLQDTEKNRAEWSRKFGDKPEGGTEAREQKGASSADGEKASAQARENAPASSPREAKATASLKGEERGKEARSAASLEIPEEGVKRVDAVAALNALKGGMFTNRATGISARLSSVGAGKLISNKAVAKSLANGFTAQHHNALAARIDSLYENAILAEERPDRNGDVNVRSIRRFVSPIRIGKAEACAYITVKESVEHGNRIYSVEGIKIAALSPTVRRAIAGHNSADNAASIADKISDPTDGVNGGGRDAQPVQGTGYTVGKARALLREDIEAKVAEAADAFGTDIQVVGVELHGSRVRGDARRDSDLDVVVEYRGDVGEDALFDALNESPINFNGLRVDVNPIRADKSGTLAEYMARSNAYDRERSSARPAKKPAGRKEAAAAPRTVVLKDAARAEKAKELASSLMSDFDSPELDSARREYDGVVARYTNADGSRKPGWMKAPNGKPTNLTERQWVQVRTPAFKCWFGDWEREAVMAGWRDVADARRFADMPAEDVSAVPPLVGKAAFKAAFKAWGEVTNAEDGRRVVFPNASAGKMERVGKVSGALNSLFERSLHAWSESDDGRHNNIAAIHHYLAKARTSDGDAYVHFTVREDLGASNAVHAATVSSVDVYKKNAEITPGKDLAKSADESAEILPGKDLATSAPFVDSKIAYLLGEVNPSAVSKVVDANGEPLVVYHGTNWNPLGEKRGDGSFRHDKIRTASEGIGFYFTASKSLASDYGMVGGYYLNLKNPVHAYDKPSLISPEEFYDYIESKGLDIEGDAVNDALDAARSEKLRDGMRRVIDSMRAKGYRFYDNIDGDFISELSPSTYESMLDYALDAESYVMDEDFDTEAFRDDFRAAEKEVFGVDGYHSPNYSGGAGAYVAFTRSQVKSATDNAGAFDAANPDIRFDSPELDSLSEEERKSSRPVGRVNPRLREEVEAALNTDRNTGTVLSGHTEVVFAEETPRALQDAGIQDGRIYTHAFILRKIRKDHDMDADGMVRLADAISRPVAILRDVMNKDEAAYIILTEQSAKDLNGRIAPVMVYLREDKRGNYLASAYSKTANGERQFVNLVNAGSILALNKNKVTDLNLTGAVKSSFESVKIGDKVIDLSRSTPRIVPHPSLLAQGGAAKVTQEEDAAYLDAVRRGDTETAQRLLRSAWERSGYSDDTSYKDAHAAPSAPVEAKDFRNVEALTEARNEGWDLNLWAVAKGITGQPDDFFSDRGPRLYGYDDAAGREAQEAVAQTIDLIRVGVDNAKIFVYRAVPKSVKLDMLQSGGQWVSPSRTYAENHGRSRFGIGKYRVIREVVRADELWWDGNDAREWGYDDGRQYVYMNDENGKKLATVTYDGSGNVIPLSERFNPAKPGIDFDSPELESEAFGRRVDAMARLVATLKEEGYGDFRSLEAYLAENFPQDRFNAARPYLRGLWDAMEERMRPGSRNATECVMRVARSWEAANAVEGQAAMEDLKRSIEDGGAFPDEGKVGEIARQIKDPSRRGQFVENMRQWREWAGTPSIADEATRLADEVDAAEETEKGAGDGRPDAAPKAGNGTIPQGDPLPQGTETTGRMRGIVTPQSFLKEARRLFPDVAIRGKGTARMATWAGGHFEPTFRVIRSRDLNAIGTVAHELGHELEHLTRYDLPRTPAAKRDLSRLGHDLYPPNGPKPNSYIGEGFAEYVRGYICNAANLSAVAPDMDAWFRGDFKTRHPEIVKKIDRLRDMVQALKEQSAADTVRGFRHPATTVAERAWKKVTDFFASENWNDSASTILKGMRKSGIDKLYRWQDEFKELEAAVKVGDMAKAANLKSIKDNGGPNTSIVDPKDQSHIAVGAYWPIEVPNAQEKVTFSAGKLEKGLTDAAEDYSSRTGEDLVPIQQFINDLATHRDAQGRVAQLSVFHDKPSQGKHNLVSRPTRVRELRWKSGRRVRA